MKIALDTIFRATNTLLDFHFKIKITFNGSWDIKTFSPYD